MDQTDNVAPRLLKEFANPISSPLCTLFKNDSAVVVFQKCGRWLFWFQFLRLTTEKLLKTMEAYRHCVLSPESSRSAFFHVFFPSSGRYPDLEAI